MKHQRIFTEFLTNVVNLNQARINKMKTSSNSVETYIKGHDDFKDLFKNASPQGSYGHRTIIKPLKNKEFDADIVFFMDENDNWEPKDYITNLHQAFKSSPTYKNMIHYNTRCVYLDYAGDFHIDVVPCIVRTTKTILGDHTEYFIANRHTNEFEQTDPEAYKQWVADKNSIVGNNNLIKCIRLTKYLRDIKTTFSCKSILLTTLMCNMIHDYESNSDDFKDIATTLKTIFVRLDNYLSHHETMPEIVNPVQTEETFTRHWTEDKYTNFKAKIGDYRTWIEDAFGEADRAESIKKWRKVFGDNFHSVVKKSATAANYNEILNEASQLHYPIPPHCAPHKWSEDGIVSSINLDVEYRNKNSINQFARAVQQFVFGKNYSLKFTITDDIPTGSDIYWQITNTGEEASRLGQLRGGFEIGGKTKEETTSYKGNHFVEAFIVKSDVLLARSGKLVVPIN
ncbi:nucleotidyltransferase [Vibrio vulnificus]|nr:nucleotidyltransferase [Vibrio vulnificus]